jgi:hypothetical protein
VTVGAADVVAPVFTAPVVIMFFLSRVTGEAVVGDLLWGLVLKGPDFGFVSAALNVSLTGTVT